MNNLSYQIYLTKGREIILRIPLSYCYHFLYLSITTSNIYPINSKTTNSEKAKSPKIIIHSISNPTKYSVASKFILTIYRNFQFINWFYGRWNELCKSIYQKSSVAKPIGNLLK